MSSPAPTEAQQPAASDKSRADGLRLAVLTGGYDKPYALGLASALMGLHIPFDFIGSDYVDSPELHGQPGVTFLNLRGDQRVDVSLLTKTTRVLAYYCKLIAYAARSKAQVFHVLWNNKFDAFDRTLLMLYYRLLGKKIVLTAHNVNIRKRDGNDTWWNRFTLGFQYKLAGHIFVHTEQMRRELLTDFPMPETKASVIPFGLNSTVPDTALTPEEARRQLGYGDEHKVLLFFGNIAAYKGVEHLVEAFVELSQADPTYRLIVAGRPKGAESYWADINQRIETSGLAERVLRKIEYVPDAETELYFKAADLFVLPYNHIFQSGVLFLGYNFGLPVVASDVGSLKEDIVEGKTGYLCRPADPKDLARAIDRSFSGPIYANRKNGRAEIKAYALEHHSWTKVGELSLGVYRNLASR